MAADAKPVRPNSAWRADQVLSGFHARHSPCFAWRYAEDHSHGCAHRVILMNPFVGVAGRRREQPFHERLRQMGVGQLIPRPHNTVERGLHDARRAIEPRCLIALQCLIDTGIKI
jgi:hypothetical protein